MLIADLFEKVFTKCSLSFVSLTCSVAATRFISIASSVRTPLAVARVSFATPFSVLALLAVHAPAVATEYECRSGSDIRYVRVDYPGIKHLCEVSVNSGRDSREVKWYADVESTFCSEKIVELVGKYTTQWGYSCEALPDHDGIDELSPRHRKYLDEIVKNNRNTEYKDQTYTLLGTRALTTSRGNSDTDSAGANTSTANANSATAADSAAAVADATGSNSLLAVQLFLGRITPDNNDPDPELAAARAESASEPGTGNEGFPPVANRLILLHDDGKNYQTLSRLEDLGSLIKINKEGYLLDSVIIDALYPNGHLDISTLIAAPGDDPSALPSCFGHQRFKQTESGLVSVTEHQISCDL